TGAWCSAARHARYDIVWPAIVPGQVGQGLSDAPTRRDLTKNVRGERDSEKKPAPHAAYLCHVASMASGQHVTALPCARVVRRKLSSASAT
ncbi:hypothetical protein, partial [Escherichia coli]|uniref:hypothetical protein n=1 Tax=Escherichia coli TaxID=562 RepID=UPI003D9AFC5A